MLGRNNYLLTGTKELKRSEWQALYLLYQPLIFNDALTIYGYFVNRYKKQGTITELLLDLNMSLDAFILGTERLNEYRLLDTYKYKYEDRYVFVLREPKSTEMFLKDEIFSRILLNTIGKDRYNELYTALMKGKIDLKDYQNMTKHLKYNSLIDWSPEKEADFHYIKKQSVPDNHIDSYFDIKRFVKEASTTLLPLKFRTADILAMIGRYADIYNISQDQMRIIVGKVVSSDLNEFNINRFKRLCAEVRPNYRSIKPGEYNVPCSLFLMNLQGGKEASPADMELFAELIERYHLPIEVVNVLIEHALKKCDNRLIRRYITGVAGDLHRINIQSAEAAKAFLNQDKSRVSKTKDILPQYDDSLNPSYGQSEYEELLRFLKESEND